ncbi:hypothetical protein [Nocardia lijiangensis]|uniref:hypothetical protein n=1 Tax=Nocardia lijiangensis TaxID=299618 RepID=UPI00082AA264|nr:hypothetical protein [Nocardia lijiangensis]
MKTISRFQRSMLVAITLAGLLSACDSSTATETSPTTSTPAAPSPAAVPPTADARPPTLAKTQGWLQIFSGIAPAGAVHVQLAVTSNPDIGQYVSDGSGRSLYRFDKDTNTPPTSTCTGQCAATWPPLTVARGQSVFAAGVDPQLVGFIERGDGSCQITIGGWPVYYFSKDKTPGDLLGQGVGGTWFAVTPTGGKALRK